MYGYREDEANDINPFGSMWLEGDSLAPPCGAEPNACVRMLDQANITPNDVVYDLGCGDGRLCFEANSRGAKKCTGVEIIEEVADHFKQIILERKLGDEVVCVCGDLLDHDYKDATVLLIYLLPEALVLIEERVQLLLESSRKSGSGLRVICNTWGFQNIKEDEKVALYEEGLNCTFWKYS
tara:strand:- start:294 stop:836 length:543 start_codon:yes stop_codon:yes gene_type:complete